MVQTIRTDGASAIIWKLAVGQRYCRAVRAMSCVTVFGGTGFLGRRVVRHLREAGETVRIASRHPGPVENNGVERIVADVHVEKQLPLRKMASWTVKSPSRRQRLFCRLGHP